MRGINKAIIAGTLGQDPEIRFTQDGKAVATLNLATNEKWKDKQGQTQEATEWHRVVLFGKSAELARDYLNKGSKIMVEGMIKKRKWQDNSGVDRWTTEIVGQQMNFLGGGEQGQNQPNNQGHNQPQASNPGDFPDYPDDIPF